MNLHFEGLSHGFVIMPLCCKFLVDYTYIPKRSTVTFTLPLDAPVPPLSDTLGMLTPALVPAGTKDDMTIVGQLGQTLDGRIATITGHSRYVNGPASLTHLHQLRACVDAVLVGVGTALADDPQLNVRLTKGRDPARIVLDPGARLAPTAKVWHEDGARRMWLVSNTPTSPIPSGVEVIVLNTPTGHIDPKDILRVLHARGLVRVLIEGGAETVSRFMRAGCLDRLHLLVAPIIMGSGRPAFNLPAIQTMDEATRLHTKAYTLEDEVIYDIDLSSQRLPIDFSNTSENR